MTVFKVHGEVLTPKKRALFEAKLQRAFGDASLRITTVDLHVADENGPKGGIDKHCRLIVIPSGQTPVVINETRRSWLSSLGMAINRAQRIVNRRHGRITDKNARSGGLRKAAAPGV